MLLNNRSRVATTAIATLVAGYGIGAQQTHRFGERVDVARIMVDARVVDDRGNPVLGLTADDFTVRIDGKGARVETATWVGESDAEITRASLASPPGAGEGPDGDGLAGDGSPVGRLMVFLFQKDLEPGRIVGLMQMLLKSRNLLDTLTTSDRVAILSFDSHLKIWTDFTSDRARLGRVFAHDLLFERPPTVQASSPPSLVERLDPERGRRTYGVERALELIGEALEPLPGSKSLVLLGHGFGRFTPEGVMMENDYEAARRALVAARTAVFSLDVTNADYHSLEAGLQLVSDQTGGFYARTHLAWPGHAQAVRRACGLLCAFRGEAGQPARHARHRGVAHAPQRARARHEQLLGAQRVADSEVRLQGVNAGRSCWRTAANLHGLERSTKLDRGAITGVRRAYRGRG